jgi:hypothetical protein
MVQVSVRTKVASVGVPLVASVAAVTMAEGIRWLELAFNDSLACIACAGRQLDMRCGG